MLSIALAAMPLAQRAVHCSRLHAARESSDSRTTCFSADVAVGMPLVGSPGSEPLRTVRSLSGGYTDMSAASRS